MISHEPTFLDIENFTFDLIRQDINSFENKVEEIALDVGVAVDNLSRSSDIDLLYLTSIGFLIVVTIAIVSGLITYKQSKPIFFVYYYLSSFIYIVLKHTTKGGERPSTKAMAATLLGAGPRKEAKNKNDSKNGH